MAEKPMFDVKPKSEPSLGQNMVEQLYTGIAEKTVAESSYHADSLQRPYNPDDLFQKTGDYSIYEDMTIDDQVNVCLRLKSDLVIGSGWDIVCEEDDQDEIKEDIELALAEDTDVPFDDSLEELLTAYSFGFSLTEKIFKHREDGALTLRALKTRHPATWLIHTDKHGNIEKYEQRGYKENLEINPKSLIHYIVNRRFQNPYGKSDLRPAYAAWFTKRQVIRYYSIFLEKNASPTPVAKYDKNAPPQAVTDIYNAIKSLQAKTAMCIPKDIEIEFLESKSNGDAYEKAINIFNMFIGRSLFIPDLVGFQGGPTTGGSLALGKEQLGLFLKHIARRRKSIEDLVNKEIIWPIVFHNHGFVDKYPKFKFRPVNDNDAVDAAKLWLEAVKGKTYKPSEEEINHFRGICKFPEGDVEYVEEPQWPQLPGQEGKPGGPQEGQGKGPEAGKKEADGKEDADKGEKKSFVKLGKLPPGDYHKKCDFKAIKQQLEAYDASMARDVKPLVALAIEDVFEQIKDKKIIQSGSIEKMESVKVRKLGAVRRLLKKSFKDIWVEGKQMAQGELFKGNYAKKKAVPDDAFLDLLEEEIWSYIGDWEYNILKRARVEMIAAIKDGKPISAVTEAVTDSIVKDAEVSLERYSRTKHTEVMNKGRLSFFEESGVVAAYQYSAIMDDVTSDICAGLDGKIFEAGSEPVPPMHFNCRSLLVAITKFEDYKLSETAKGMPIFDFIEQNKGAGFPTQ